MSRESLYGTNAVRESLLAGRRRPATLWTLKGGREGRLGEIIDLARQRQVRFRETNRGHLDQLAGNRHHQGLVLQTTSYPYVDVEDAQDAASVAGEPPFLLVLDLLQDPQNLGSLLRTAEVVGVHGVVIPERRAVGVTPAVVNASAGAAEWLRVVQVTNLARTMKQLSEQGVWLVGLEDVAEAASFDQMDWPSPLALVVGSEGEGLRRLTRERCDLLVRLPMGGHITSLNAAVAGSIALYAAWRSRR